MNKPFIQFGISNIIDSNFYKFHISENLKKFNEKHFFGSPELTILPYIDNNDTTLTFILEYDKIPIHLQHSNYLRLHINEYSFWRITSKNKIFSGDKLFIKFNCKRDIITEYFSLKQHSLLELPLLYVIRSTFIKPTLENLAICSNACLNDTKFNDIENVLINVNTDNKIDGLFYEFETTSKNIMSDILKEFNKFYFYFSNSIKDYIVNNTKNWNTNRNIVVGNIDVDVKDYKVVKGNIFTWRKYGTSEPGGEWWDSNKSGYLRNKKPFYFEKVLDNAKRNSASQIYIKNESYLLLSKNSYTKYFNSRAMEDERFNAFDLITEVEPQNKYIVRDIRVQLWDVRDKSQIGNDGNYIFKYYYTYQQDNGDNPNPFYKKPIHRYLDNLNLHNFLICFNGLKDYKENYGWIDNYNDISPTEIGGVKKSYIIDFNKNIYNLSKIFISYRVANKITDMLNIYYQSIDNWVAYISSKFNIKVNKLNSLSGKKVIKSNDINGGFYNLQLKDNGELIVNDKVDLFKFNFIKEVKDNIQDNIIITGKTPETHYEASHIKKFVYGNKIGVFKIQPELDYSIINIDAKSKLIYSTYLSHLNEMGTINENYENLGQITNKRLLLETNAEKFRINSIYNKTLLDNKINNMRKQNDFQKNINRTQRINNIIKSIGGTAITAGMTGAFGTGGAITGNIINNALWGNVDAGLNEYVLDYKTNQEILNLQQDHKLNTQLQADMYNLETYSDLAVSAFLTNISDNKFPWLKQENIYLNTVEFGDKEKIEIERWVYGDFINNYHIILPSMLKPSPFYNFLMIDAAKSFNFELPGLTQLEIELLKQNLSNGIQIIYDY